MIGQTYNPDKCVFIANQSLNANQVRSVAGNSNSTTHIVLWNLEENKLLWVNTKNNIVENEISGASQPTYKVYTALLNQTGISAPVATVLENTIGDITWTYESTGVYYANSSNLFNGNIFISPYIYYNNEIDAMVVLSSDPQYNTNNILQFFCSANNAGIDGRLINIPIEIRVYN